MRERERERELAMVLDRVRMVWTYTDLVLRRGGTAAIYVWLVGKAFAAKLVHTRRSLSSTVINSHQEPVSGQALQPS